MTQESPKFLNTAEAAQLLGLSEGYLVYLRSEQAKERNHKGPPYLRINLRDGSHQPIRVKYDKAEIEAWDAERQAQRALPPTIEHVAS